MFGNMLGGMNKDNAQGQVTELLDRLKTNANLSDEQAQQVLHTLKDFVVEKYPMLQGAVSSIFGGDNK
jgi:predicted nucleic acid-binding protein